jgi:uncharacterized protein
MECKNIVENGSIDLSRGCPVCGGKKFQYIRPHKKEAESEADLRKLTVSEYVARADAAESRRVAPARETPLREADHKVKEPARAPRALKIEAREEAKPAAKDAAKEAQKPARGDKKSHHERIESVRILEKGRYDLNLPVLLNRKELVMSKEDGVYVVDLPSALKTPKTKKR